MANSPKPLTVGEEIQQLDRRWLHVHHNISAVLAIWTFIMEMLMYLFIEDPAMMTAGPLRYAVRYIIIPSGTNALLWLAGWKVIRSTRMTYWGKVYIVSLIMIGICFVIFTVHSFFVIVGMIFIAPMILTVIYGSQRLTTLTFMVSVGMMLIAWAIPWDLDRVITPLIQLNMAIGVIIQAGLYVVCMVIINFTEKRRRLIRRQDAENAMLHQRMLKDPLTGVGNRAAMRAGFDRVLENPDQPYHAAMLDIDGFKQLNDARGHLFGDRVLERLGSILQTLLVSRDVGAYRYGGDEFVLLFFADTPEKSQAMLQEILDRVDQSSREAGWKISLSAGLVTNLVKVRPQEVLRQADAALYQAKTRGGNQICCEAYKAAQDPGNETPPNAR